MKKLKTKVPFGIGANTKAATVNAAMKISDAWPDNANS